MIKKALHTSDRLPSAADTLTELVLFLRLFFIYWSSPQDDEDVQLTVTPMRGDPALYAEMGAIPRCAAPGEDEGDVGGGEVGGAGGIVCSGWWVVLAL